MHLIANLDRGGGQEVVRTLARHLPAFGVDPVVVTLKDGPLRQEIEALGVPVEVMGGRTHSILAGPVALAELARVRRDIIGLARAHRVQVLQTHLLRSLDFLTLTTRQREGIRSVYWTVHNAQLELRADQVPNPRWALAPKRLSHRAMYRVGGRMADGFVAVSDDVGKAVRLAYRPPLGRLTVIANGVDVDRYGMDVDRDAIRRSVGVEPGTPLIIVVAKLMRQKGHMNLIAALPTVVERHPALQVLLLGEGELRSELEAAVREAGLLRHVAFLGNRADVPDLLAASDLFVLPSLWEGLPMALLEAMASRLPVVATSVSGTREVLEHGRSGVLVPAGSAAELAEGILQVLGQPGVARSLGDAARRRVEDCYSARAQAARHAELYRARLASRPITGGG
jgi:glycosyltransferase involved in cell wall biosynthesis